MCDHGEAMTALVDATSSDLSGDAVLRAAAGDRDAFGALYRRYAGDVFDLAARLLRDRSRAVDIVRATFVEAWTQVEGTEPSATGARQLLLGTAARLGVADAKRPHRAPIEERLDLELAAAEVRLAPGASRAFADGTDLDVRAEAVWAVAAMLDPEDYALIDLWMRRGFPLPVVVSALGRNARLTTRRAFRLRDSIDETITALSVARHGRAHCPALRQLLAELPAHAPHARIRDAVAAHLDHGCIGCAVHRSTVMEPTALLGSLALIPFPDGRETGLWDGIRESLAGPRVIARRRRRQRSHRVTAAAAALALVVLAGAAIAYPRADGRDTVATIDDPADAHSISHETGTESPRDRITVAWSRHPRATGYSVEWSRDRSALPDRTVDLPGSATEATSPRLTPGTWWFSLRTRGRDGSWTSTVRLGPFVVADPATDDPTGDTTVPPETSTSSSSSTTVKRTTTTRKPTTTTAARAAATTTSTTARSPRPSRPSPTSSTTAPPSTTTPTTGAPPSTTTPTTVGGSGDSGD